MRNIFCSLAIATALYLGVAGCQTTQQAAKDQAAEAASDRLTQAEVISHVSGNTEVWSEGGGYYAPDGAILVTWQGDDGSGTWEVAEDGTLCLAIDLWGNENECHHYVNDGGTFMLVYDNRPRLAEILPGNQLNSL